MADNRNKKKQFALMGTSVLLVAAVVGTVAATLSLRNSGTSPNSAVTSLATSVKSVNAICEPTDYRDTCEKALNSVAGNATDPKDLIQASFKVTVDHIRAGINHSDTLQALAKDPSTADALKNCKELLDYAIDDLKNSIDQLAGLELSQVNKVVDDLMIWLSAVVTYQETCFDGFDNATSPEAESMRRALKTSGELTSNALAIVDEISKVLGHFDLPNFNRQLLSQEDGVPSWVSSGERRLQELAGDKVVADVTVAQDGSGDCTSINEALKKVPPKNTKPFVIYVKEGVYKEKVVVDKTMKNVVMIGDGPTKTKITGNLNFIDGVKTFDTASFVAIGDGFIGKNFGMENSAGPEKHQAVALLVQSDKAVFYNCQMDGYQDTLYAHTHRQFYRECTISGTIDFIFGDAASYFQNCLILARKPLDNQQNIVTAQGRKERRERSGIILHNCTISADPAYLPYQLKLPTYLGRPWKDFSRTYILQSQLDDLIHPDGWLPWDGTMYLNTLTYSEFDNRGPGSNMAKRVTWKGIKPTDLPKAQKFTVDSFFRGSSWLPQTGVPFTPGLLPQASPVS